VKLNLAIWRYTGRDKRLINKYTRFIEESNRNKESWRKYNRGKIRGNKTEENMVEDDKS
jgi:hypothetical protein